MTASITVPFTLSTLAFSAIAKLAAFGSRYWANGTDLLDRNQTIQLRYYEGSTELRRLISRQRMEEVIAQIVNGTLCSDSTALRSHVRALALEDDASQLDVHGADQLIQLAAFGEILYG